MIQKLMAAAKKYTVKDYVFLKLVLISFGILLGSHFAQLFLNISLLIWVVFIVSFIWIAYVTVIKCKQ